MTCDMHNTRPTHELCLSTLLQVFKGFCQFSWRIPKADRMIGAILVTGCQFKLACKEMRQMQGP